MIESVERLVRISGARVLSLYEGEQKAIEKKDKSLLTEADLASEEILKEGLKKFGYPVLSEETADHPSRLRASKVWVLDPLDGTLDFIKKTGEFSIMLALVEEGRPVFGIVYGPVLNKLYFAEEGKGAFLSEGGSEPKKLAVSKESDFSKARFVVSRHHLIDSEKNFLDSNKLVVARMGSLGLKLGLIAEGKAEGYINFSDKTAQWDTAAPEIVLSEAGGITTDLKGDKFKYNRKETKNLNGVLASNKLIHEDILARISKQ